MRSQNQHRPGEQVSVQVLFTELTCLHIFFLSLFFVFFSPFNRVPIINTAMQTASPFCALYTTTWFCKLAMMWTKSEHANWEPQIQARARCAKSILSGLRVGGGKYTMGDCFLHTHHACVWNRAVEWVDVAKPTQARQTGVRVGTVYWVLFFPSIFMSFSPWLL